MAPACPCGLDRPYAGCCGRLHSGAVVAATAEQADRHGLGTVTDLRGRFDPDDVSATYRWQLDHLFPRPPRPVPLEML